MIAAYEPTLRADFVDWDDPIHVYENPRVIEPDALRRGWSDGSNPGFYPVLFSLYRAEWRAAGGRPWLFHLDNVLLHAGNTLLVGMLVRQVGMLPPADLLVAGLWALHPAHVESVAWITERKNTLYAFFWLASLLLFIRWRRTDSSRALILYVASLLLYACSLLSKGAAITLPAAFVLVEWARGGRLERRFWLALAPFVALGIVSALELVQLVPAGNVVPPLAARVAVACRAFWFYLATFLWPWGLLPVYPRWSLDGPTPGDLLAVLGVVTLLAVGIAVRARVPRVVLLGAGLFVTNVFPVLGIVWNSYMVVAFVADRYLYLPAVGLAMAAVAGLGELRRIVGLPTRAASAAAIVPLAVLGVATWRQVPIWHDSGVLWNYTLARHPECGPCHEHLGDLSLDRNDLASAAQHYEKAMQLTDNARSVFGLGNVRLRQGRLDEAAALYEIAGRDPDLAMDSAYNLGIVLQRQGRLEDAIVRFREVVRVRPDWPDAHDNLGVALLHADHADEARAQFEEVLRVHPGDVEAQVNLGAMAAGEKDWEAAERFYGAALAGARDDRPRVAALIGLGDALAQQDKLADALSQYEAALRLSPDDVGALGVVAWIRATSPDARLRDGSEAVRLAERACALMESQTADALDTLAAAYAEAGQFADAVRVARQAIDAADSGSPLADDIRRRLARYEVGEPYRAR